MTHEGNGKPPGPAMINGLLYRGLGYETDFSKMSAVYNRAAVLDNPEFLPVTPEDLSKRFNITDPEQCNNVLIVEADGEMIGWGSCGIFRQRQNLLVGYHELCLLPVWRNLGIELPVLQNLEKRVSELSSDCPAQEAIYKLFIPETNQYTLELLQSAGYTRLAAHAIMMRPDLENIPDEPLPQGIEIRPAQDGQLREIYEAYSEAFREHIHGTEPGDEDFAEWSQEPYLADRTLWVVAWDVQAERIAGLILNFILADENDYYQRKRGYVEFISVLKPYRRMGLARAMIAASLRKHKANGMQEAALSSHTENPFNPISLYTKMGFQTCYYTLVYSKTIQNVKNLDR